MSLGHAETFNLVVLTKQGAQQDVETGAASVCQ